MDAHQIGLTFQKAKGPGSFRCGFQLRVQAQCACSCGFLVDAGVELVGGHFIPQNCKFDAHNSDACLAGDPLADAIPGMFGGCSHT